MIVMSMERVIILMETIIAPATVDSQGMELHVKVSCEYSRNTVD